MSKFRIDCLVVYFQIYHKSTTIFADYIKKTYFCPKIYKYFRFYVKNCRSIKGTPLR